MAVEYALLDLFHVFVEVIFGSFFLAIIGVAVLFLVFCFLLRMSLFLTLSIVLLFLIVMLVGYFGSFFGVFIFAISGTYFVYALIRWIQGYVT
jgi:hypothetical protein